MTLTDVNIKALMHLAAVLSAPTYKTIEATVTAITWGKTTCLGDVASTIGKYNSHKNLITIIDLLLLLQ